MARIILLVCLFMASLHHPMVLCNSDDGGTGNDNLSTSTTMDNSTGKHSLVRLFKKTNASNQDVTPPKIHISDATKTESYTCNSEGWEIHNDIIFELLDALSEQELSLVKFDVILTASNSNKSIVHAPYHWVLDAKGSWIHEGLICPASWLPIKLGMFHDGVYKTSISLILPASLSLDNLPPSKLHIITSGCLEDLTTTVLQKLTEQGQYYFTETQILQVQANMIMYNHVYVCYSGLIEPWLFVARVFMYLILPYLFIFTTMSRVIPKVCFQDGNICRLNLSINPLPAGFKYIAVFWKPFLNPIRWCVLYIFISLVPVISRINYHMDWDLTAILNITCACTAIAFCSFIFRYDGIKNHSQNRIPSQETIQYLSDFTEFVQIEKAIEQNILVRSDSFTSIQDLIDFLSSNLNEYLKIIISKTYWHNIYNIRYERNTIVRIIIGGGGAAATDGGGEGGIGGDRVGAGGSAAVAAADGGATAVAYGDASVDGDSGGGVNGSGGAATDGGVNSSGGGNVAYGGGATAADSANGDGGAAAATGGGGGDSSSDAAAATGGGDSSSDAAAATGGCGGGDSSSDAAAVHDSGGATAGANGGGGAAPDGGGGGSSSGAAVAAADDDGAVADGSDAANGGEYMMNFTLMRERQTLQNLAFSDTLLNSGFITD
ncbi:uncharacterized protein [Amphiura filiformis]|uniref:uncharacterized protein n=1 Tax=Amphiura filiformis TaxID=82378 RepID=UPI003B21F867